MMKRIAKLFSLTLVAVCLITLLISCTDSTEKAAGKYVGSYTEDGSSYQVSIILTKQGTYARTIHKDGEPHSSIAGYYSLENSVIRLYDKKDRLTYSEYQYHSEKLEQNGHFFEKTDENLDEYDNQ